MSKHKSITPTVPIELDKTRNILFDFAALEALEEALELPGVTLGSDFWEKMSIKRARIALWAGLIHEDATLTVDQVKDLVKGIRPSLILGTVLAAWALSRSEPSKDDEPADPPQPETNQPGSASGA